MKAVILAAGEGSRLRPLTSNKPKPCIKIFGKPIIEYNLDNLVGIVDEVIIVVKYKEDILRNMIGSEYEGMKIVYHTQGDYKGTGGALRGVEDLIDDDFYLLNGDSIFDKYFIEELDRLDGYGCLVKKVDNPERYGIFHIEDSKAKGIVEKPIEYVGNLANLGVYKFGKDMLRYIASIEESPRGEYEITDAINMYVENQDFYLLELPDDFEGVPFMDIGYPWDILTANKYFIDTIDGKYINGEIEEGVTINGNIILEDGAILKSGTYIEGNVYIGKNSVIGPNSYLRGGTVIGENSKVGNAVEIKNSSIGDNTKVPHLSYVGYSVIGDNTNIGGGFISASLRHDAKTIKVMVKGELVDTGKRKLGAIIGNNVKTAINTSVYPGRVIESDSFTIPGEIVK